MSILVGFLFSLLYSSDAWCCFDSIFLLGRLLYVAPVLFKQLHLSASLGTRSFSSFCVSDTIFSFCISWSCTCLQIIGAALDLPLVIDAGHIM